VLGGRYELGPLLGRGGMAEVHEALDRRLNRTVAVKMLRTDLARDASFQARFRREAQSAASLNAPTIVAVYDTGEDMLDGARVPYIVMEYVSGQTLRELLRSGQRLTVQRSLEITDQTLQALDYSHRNGIVHRDIKPANIMVTRSGQVKVMDFGIARAVADSGATLTQTSNVLGTAQYLSPEQARGETVDARSDVYSAGCLLYELVTGQPPFSGESPVAVAYQHVRETAPVPSTVNPDVPTEVDAIVMKSMAKNPDNRYQTAAEMRADVDRAMHGIPVAAPPVMADLPTQTMSGLDTTAAIATTGSPTRRRAGWYIALTLAVVAVLGLLGAAAWALFGADQNKVVVPDVRGQSVEQARATLQAKGLELGVQTPQPSEEPKNTVIAQNPPADTEVTAGQTVDITFSSGPEQVPVPPVVGLSQSDAIAAIQAVGLKVGRIKQQASDQPAGNVIESRPPEGTSVDAGSSVTLVLSTGEVAVPGVFGQTEAQARATLGQAGFDVSVVYVTGTGTPGTVVAQSPTADTPLRLGSVVTISVLQAPTPTPTTPTPSPPGSGSPSASP
jgi:beta-lactam-binding protein with PASTA domain/tRNA A-37 threonylcarbamoyl transferase component Bud32